MSNTLFNERTGLTIVCPLTSTDRGYPFHVAVAKDPDVKGFVMVEQVKSIDFRARQVKKPLAEARGSSLTVTIKSELLVPDIGGKAKKYMKRKVKYTDEPMGEVKVVSDFLPSPEELVLQDETVKVTIALSKASVESLKNEAKKSHTQYQKMIRRLLDEYAAHRP